MAESSGSNRTSTGPVTVVYRGINIASAILLLTGQITNGGVFLAPGTFALSLSGPFTGSGAEGTTPNAKLVLDAVDVIVALLLIIDQIQVVGSYITHSRFTIVVGGPPFGGSTTEAYTPQARDFFSDFRTEVQSRYS